MHHYIETIRVEDGQLPDLTYHNARFNETRIACCGAHDRLQLADYLHPHKMIGVHRCRVVYTQEVNEVSYHPYTIRPIASIRLVKSEEIDYRYKALDRDPLNRLFALRDGADEVLIVKQGLLTDTSIANIALFDGAQWMTPSSPLLKGTRRASLLAEGSLVERKISAADILNYQKIRLFNAMIGFGEVELLVNESTLLR